MALGPLISIIDDGDSLRRALVRLIGSLGCDARGFRSAEQFAESGAISSSACVVTDTQMPGVSQMPGMSGIELKQLLVQRRCPVPIIMITAHHEPGLKEKAYAVALPAFLGLHLQRQPSSTVWNAP